MSDPHVHDMTPVSCLARAWRGEPFAADAIGYWLVNPRVGRNGEPYIKTVYLVRQGHGHAAQDDDGLGFPAEDCFQWDGALFDKLQAAWNDGDPLPTLVTLWAKASALRIKRTT